MNGKADELEYAPIGAWKCNLQEILLDKTDKQQTITEKQINRLDERVHWEVRLQ